MNKKTRSYLLIVMLLLSLFNISSMFFPYTIVKATSTPVVTTNATINTEETNTTLCGSLDDGGGESCRVGFEYGTTTSYGKTDYNLSIPIDVSGDYKFPKEIWLYNISIENNHTIQNFCTQGGIYDNITWVFRLPDYAFWKKGVGGGLRYIDNSTDHPTYSYLFIMNNADILSFTYENLTNSGVGVNNPFNQNLTDLNPGTLYHYRAFATNSSGTGYGSDMTFLTKPLEPENLTVSSYNDTQITFTWTKGTGANNTVIRRKTGAYPTDYNDGVEAYNGTASTFTDTGLTPSRTHYYRAWSYTTWNPFMFSDSYDEESVTLQPQPPQNVTYNLTTSGITANLYINWTRGKNATHTLVRKKDGSYPTDYADGTLVYNGTANTTVDTNINSSALYRVWSFNDTTNQYSTHVNVQWAAIWLNCYNETDGSDIINWDVFISNPLGTEVYTSMNVNNSHIINVSACPTGSNIGFKFSADNYSDRSYYLDIELNGAYYLDAYLPPENDSNLYVLVVYDEYFYPVDNAKMEVKRYINETIGFENVSIKYTDVSGKISLYLTEEVTHKVIISKDGYETEISDFDTDPDYYGVLYPIEFQLQSTVEEPELYEFWYLIKFNATMYSNNSMKVMYEDTYTNTTNAQFYTYENFNFTTTLLFTNTTTSDTFVFWVNGINISREHEVFICLNHTNLGYSVHSIIVPPIYTPSYPDIEAKLRAVFGDFELDFVPILFVYIPAIILLVIFGKSHPGMGIIGSGLWMGFVGIYLAIPVEAAALAPFIVCIGILLIYVKGGKSKL